MGLFKSIKKGFKKIGKGFKSAFKSIGKGIKSAMGKIGKFMNKIGIVGQLALMFTPVGAMMSNMFSSIGNVAGGMFSKVVGKAAVQGAAGSGLLGSSSVILRGAGTVLKAAGSFAKAGHSAFKTITEGMTSFVTEFSKTALKKIPGMQSMMPKFLGESVSDNFFGTNGAWSKVQGVVSENATAVLNNFNEAIGNTDKILTAGQSNLKLKAEAQVNKAATGVDSVGPMKENYAFPDSTKSLDFDVSGFGDATKATEALGGGIPVQKDSLLGRVTDSITEGYNEWKGEDRTFGEALVDTGVEIVQDKLKEIPDEIAGGLKTRLYQNVGLQAKPVQNIYQSRAYVPEFNMAPAGQYASAEINDRAMQVQLSGGQYHMQNPYGFGANDYLNKMAVATGGTA